MMKSRSPKTKNRWLIALSAVAIHLSIGSVYGWSVYAKPLAQTEHWSLPEVSATFSVAIFVLGLASAVLGRFVERRGPRVSAMVAAAFWGAGVAGSSLAVSAHSLWLLYLSYGLIGGIGLGIGYIAPVSTLVKWFPDRRGLATGLAIMGFGFGALVSGPVAAYLIQTRGLAFTFLTLGIAYFVVMFLAAQYMARPADDWRPAGWAASTAAMAAAGAPAALIAVEAVRTRRFWLLWLMLFLNVSAGIMLISVASPMAQDIVHMTPLAAAAVVGFLGLFNGLGRIFWASISDYVGRANVFTTFFVIGITAFTIFPHARSAVLFVTLLYAVITVYGGGFASVPAYIADLFGTKELGAIHGYILTAWSLAGVVGPTVVSLIKQATRSYVITFYVFDTLLVVALLASLRIRQDIRAMRAGRG